MTRRRWFAAKNETITGVRIAYAVPLASVQEILVIEVEVETSGRTDRYLMPAGIAWEQANMPPLVHQLALARVRRGRRVGYVTDGFALEALPRAILNGLKNNGRMEIPGGEIRCLPTERVAALQGIDQAPIRWLTAEQSNSSLLVGDLAIVKLIRRIVPGIHPEAEMTRYLTAVGYANTAPLLGEVVRFASDGTPHTLAIVQGVIPNQGDAWTWVLDNLRRAVEDAALAEAIDHPEFQALNAFMGTVGTRLGELHKALATPTEEPDFRPVEADAEAVERWTEGARVQIEAALDALAAQRETIDPNCRPLANAVVAKRKAVLDMVDRLGDAGRGSLMTRVHGDFHLGQILVSQGDAYIIDFEGEPTRGLDQRRLKGTPLRDVAGLLRSIDYAAASVGRLEEDASPSPVRDRRQTLLDEFRRQATDAFLQGYHAALGSDAEAGTAKGRGSLLDLMLLEKAAYEISYEVANRPKWIPIPLRGFSALIERLTGREGRS